MIGLLRIHAVVRPARVLVFVGMVADRLGGWCLHKATTIAADVTAWCDARGYR